MTGWTQSTFRISLFSSIPLTPISYIFVFLGYLTVLIAGIPHTVFPSILPPVFRPRYPLPDRHDSFNECCNIQFSYYNLLTYYWAFLLIVLNIWPLTEFPNSKTNMTGSVNGKPLNLSVAIEKKNSEGAVQAHHKYLICPCPYRSSSLKCGHCVVFLATALNSQSLHTGV